jgi:hypothetical protein
MRTGPSYEPGKCSSQQDLVMCWEVIGRRKGGLVEHDVTETQHTTEELARSQRGIPLIPQGM